MKSLKEYRYLNNPSEKEYMDGFIDSLKSEVTMNYEYFYKYIILSERASDIILSTIHWFATPVGSNFVKKFYECYKSEIDKPQNSTDVEVDVVSFFKEEMKYSSDNIIDIIIFGAYSNDSLKSDNEVMLFEHTLKWLPRRHAIIFNERYIDKLN